MASIVYPATRTHPPRDICEPRYGNPAAVQIVAVDTDNARPCVPGQACETSVARTLPSRRYQPHAALGGHGDIVERMRALKQLFESDLITKAEYEDGKRKLMSMLLEGTEQPPKPRSELAEEAAIIEALKANARDLSEYTMDLLAWGNIPDSEWKQRQQYPAHAVAQAVAKVKALLQKFQSPPQLLSSASQSDITGQRVPSPSTPPPNKSGGRLVLIQQDRAAEWKTMTGAMASSGRRKQDTGKTLHIRKSEPAPRKATGKVEAVTVRASPSSKQAKRRLNLGTASACVKNGTQANGKAIRHWTEMEHTQFLAGFQRHGRGKWKAIARHVPSRSEKQVEDHAKFFFHSLKGKRGADAIHWKVRVWWDLDKTYYDAWVTDYNRDLGKHKLYYLIDQMEEWLDLRRERVVFTEMPLALRSTFAKKCPRKQLSPQKST